MFFLKLNKIVKILIFLVMIVLLFFSLIYFKKKKEYITTRICGVFEFHTPKPSQRATNIEILTFNIDGYGDLYLPIDNRFDINGVSLKTLKEGDRVCMLVPIEKKVPENLKTAYAIFDINFSNTLPN